MNLYRKSFFMILLFICGVAQAQVEAIEAMKQKVIDDYLAMKDMTAEQRAAFRQSAQRSMDSNQRKAYQLAFKAVRPQLPALLGEAAETNNSTTTQFESVRVPGTNITYDTGTVVNTGGVASQMIGNRFDTALDTSGVCCSPVETSGTVTMATFYMVNTFFSSAVFSLYSNVVGTAANQVTSMGRGGLMTGLNTITVNSPTTANQYANGSVLGGIWQFDPTMTALGLDTGTTGGQGFHAISLNDGAMGSMLTTVTSGGMGINAIFRMSGNLSSASVPVELIDFTIEDK